MACAITLTACDINYKVIDTINIILSDEELVKNTKLYYKSLIEGEYTIILEDLDNSVQEFYTVDTLTYKNEHINSIAGEFVQFKSVDVITKNDNKVVLVVSKHDKADVDFFISINEDMKIINIGYDIIEHSEYVSDKEHYKHVTENEQFLENEHLIKIKTNTNEELDGILTLPTNIPDGEKVPVVILVTNFGEYNYDYKIGDFYTYKNLAHRLANDGIASIRYNKRYYQYPDKADDDITVYTDIIDDVNSATSYADNVSVIDSDKIYLLGHGLGAMVLPYISNTNSYIDGIIEISSTANNYYSLIEKSTNQMLENADNYAYVKEEKDKMERFLNGEELSSSEHIFNRPISYWKTVSDVTNTSNYENLKIPIFVIQFENGIISDIENDFTSIISVMKNNGNKDFVFGIYGDHLNSEEEPLNTYGYLEMFNNMVDDIAKFIKMY